MDTIINVGEKSMLREMNKKMDKYNENFLNIEYEAVKQCEKERYLNKIGSNKNGNVYYDIVGDSYNTILMHVKENKYILLNKRILTRDGKNMFDSVEILKKSAFCIKSTGKRRERVVTTFSSIKDINEDIFKNKQVTIERVMTGYHLYGGLIRIDKNIHVHHDHTTYDNRMFVLQCLTKQEHKKLHSEESQESHMKGIYISSAKELKAVLMEHLKMLDIHHFL